MFLKCYLVVSAYWFIILTVTCIKAFREYKKNNYVDYKFNPTIDFIISMVIIFIVAFIPIVRFMLVREMNKEN